MPEYSRASLDEECAYQLATALDDMRSLGFYRKLAQAYSHGLLREILAKALATPAHKVKKSRGAIFTGIWKRYGCAAKPSSRGGAWMKELLQPP